MSDTEPTLAELLQVLKTTNASITALNQKVEAQAQTIESLKVGAPPAKKAIPAEEVSEVELLREKLNKTVDQNNKFYAEQRKEKLYKATKDAMIERGISPKRIELAFAVVKDKISIDTAGNMKMLDGNGVENRLEEELTRFAESETGAFFKEPINAQGAGTPPMRNGAPGSNSNVIRPVQSNNPADVQSEADFNQRIMNVLGF